MKSITGHLGLFIWRLFVGFLIFVYGIPTFFLMLVSGFLGGENLEKVSVAAVSPGISFLPIPYEVKKTFIENGTLTFILYLFVGIICWPILKGIRVKLESLLSGTEAIAPSPKL
jgi:hypothetical protein